MYTTIYDWMHSKLSRPCGQTIGRNNALGFCSGKLRCTSKPEYRGVRVSFSAQCIAVPEHIHTFANDTDHKIQTRNTGKGRPDKRTGIHNINQLKVLAHTFAGQDYESVRLADTIMLGHSMNKKQWYDHQNRVWEAVTIEFEISAERVQAMIKESGEWIMEEDMGWSNTGWAAYHGSLPLVWHGKKLIVLHEVLSKDFVREGQVSTQGNYKGSSGGMEGHALRNIVRTLHSKGLLQLATDCVMDKDSTASKIFKEEFATWCQHLKIRYDPGHVKKSLINNLKQVHALMIIT